MPLDVATGYAPRGPFIPYHMRAERHAVLVAHRRAGKTVACVNDQIDRALRDTSGQWRAGYIAPFLRQAKEIAWDYLKQYSGPVIAEKNESELWVRLINGARIRLYGADNPDSIRGGYFNDAILDEYGDIKPSLWADVVRPMLADRQGKATIIGTPKGRNDFYRMSERAKQSDDWFHAILRASETGILPESELRAAREEMDEESYKREFECDFHAAIRGAVYGAQMSAVETEGRQTIVNADPMLPVVTAWDLGMSDATSIWFAQMSGREVRLVDFYQASGAGLDHYAGVLREKNYRYAEHLLPHDAAQRELGTGRSRVETLHQLGVTNIRVLPNLSIEDGIAQSRLLLPRCWFDERRCADGLEALRQYRYEYDERLQTLRPRPRHDQHSHAADAFRYLAVGLRALSDAPRQMKAIDDHHYGA